MTCVTDTATCSWQVVGFMSLKMFVVKAKEYGFFGQRNRLHFPLVRNFGCARPWGLRLFVFFFRTPALSRPMSPHQVIIDELYYLCAHSIVHVNIHNKSPIYVQMCISSSYYGYWHLRPADLSVRYASNVQVIQMLSFSLSCKKESWKFTHPIYQLVAPAACMVFIKPGIHRLPACWLVTTI
jgi:hypothetical protein